MPKTPPTKYERLGSIFGQPTFSLETVDLPKKNEIIRYWMMVHEMERGDSWILKDDQQKVVRNKVSLC